MKIFTDCLKRNDPLIIHDVSTLTSQIENKDSHKI